MNWWRNIKSKKLKHRIIVSIVLLYGFLLITVVSIMAKRYGVESTLLLVICIPIILDFINTNYLRHKGKYPPKGQVTLNDVMRFVSEGKTILALRAYRELHNCGIIHAEKAIQEIRKEILNQKLEEKGSQSK